MGQAILKLEPRRPPGIPNAETAARRPATLHTGSIEAARRSALKPGWERFRRVNGARAEECQKLHKPDFAAERQRRVVGEMSREIPWVLECVESSRLRVATLQRAECGNL